MALDTRYLNHQIISDLKKKMVFVAGPRQVGKTYVAKKLPGGVTGYMNWDTDKGKDMILAQTFPESRLWIFDEIHKYRKWRNYLKGIYDSKLPSQQILVTGSARLDLYGRGGDSLQGRYHLLRMNPLSAKELGMKTGKELETLLHLNGFPEPFFSSSKAQTNRWSLEYRKRLVREEVSSLEKIEDLATMEMLTRILPSRVGSPLSLNGLREELQVAHATVAKWCVILENLYSFFRISPYGYKLARAVKKEQKLYFYDWNLMDEPSIRFENMVACHLKKWVEFQEDSLGDELSLQYFRNTDKKEVDFVITKNTKAKILVECKWSDAPVSDSLRYLKSKHPEAKAWQIHMHGKKDYQTPDGIRVTSAITFLNTLI